MVIRSLVVAALLAGSAAAHANPVSTTGSGVLGGWTLSAGSVSVVGALNSLDAIIASGNWSAFNQAWNMHTSLNTLAGSSAVLFAPNAQGGVSALNVGTVTAPALVTGSSAGGGSATVTGNVPAGDLVVSMPAAIGAMPAALPADMPVVLAADVVAAEVPEPGTVGLMLAGLAGAGLLGRRRQK